MAANRKRSRKAPASRKSAPGPRGAGGADRLVGTWKIEGRTLHRPRIDIAGRAVIEWLPGGRLLQQRSTFEVAGRNVTSLEIIDCSDPSKVSPAYVYTSLDQGPLSYRWDLRGPKVVHSGLGARFTGEFNEDGTRLTGGWRPVGRTPPTPGNSYDVVMTREA